MKDSDVDDRCIRGLMTNLCNSLKGWMIEIKSSNLKIDDSHDSKLQPSTSFLLEVVISLDVLMSRYVKIQKGPNTQT
jgi:hypothetical protein